MRPLLQFLGFCFIVFFIVGEFQGWYVGVPPQTPMYLYKIDKTVKVVRDVKFDDELQLGLTGRVQNGNILVEVFFEVPASFQAGTPAVLPKKIYEEVFYTGQSVNFTSIYDEGKGRYTVILTYEDATGSFRLKLPSEKAL